jgi:lipid-A-disaccharide synthase
LRLPGTASLEAALAGAAPVVTYRMGRLGFALARRLVRLENIALPNILLGRRAFPELLQDEVSADGVAESARAVLRETVATGRGASLASELAAMLAPPSPPPFGARLADLLRSWLAEGLEPGRDPPPRSLERPPAPIAPGIEPSTG